MLDYKNPKLILETANVEPGAISWESPSNLAIVKYWGKHGVQLPRNPSLSFTLEAAHTKTTLEYAPKSGADTGIALEFFYDNEPNEGFKSRIQKYLESVTEIFPFLKQLSLTIKTVNSFPHSAGIASSASGMSALALCLCSLEDILFGTLEADEDFRQKASFLARLGSGSACRSIFSKAGFWGKFGEVEDSSDLYAVPFEYNLHEVFHTYQNDILIVSKEEKSVSSSAGHALMDQHTYAESRYKQANLNLHYLIGMLLDGDVDGVGRILEQEALTLHALMMASNPPYLLMQPNTINIIKSIRNFRADTEVPLYFSLDAGPNPHLLYPLQYKEQVKQFIDSELIEFCENGFYLEDQVGFGPKELEASPF